MKTNDIKKGTEVKTTQLGVPVTGVMMDSLRGNTSLIKTHGSEVGMFDEIGSVYSHDIVDVKVDDAWLPVTHTEAQLKLKQQVKELF